MTDEEKAEEILQTKGSMTFCAKGCGYTEKVKELIAIGLAEGRKEGYAQGEQMLMASGEIVKKGFLDNLEKENTELKEKHESDKRALKLIVEKGNKLEKDKAELKAQIKIMKNCANCRHFKHMVGCMKADKPNHRQCDIDNWESWECKK